MGAGRKTETIQVSEWSPRSSSGGAYQAIKNLSKSSLGGAIFGCKHNTMGECLTKQLFGLPYSHFPFVRNIEPGLTLFLFNYSDRKMHGIYEAASHGEMNIDPYAWTNDGTEKTGFPAQVRICVRMQCQPITENQFKKVIGDNYYKPHHFYFELSHAQTEGLIALFLASDISMTARIPPSVSTDANHSTTSGTAKCNVLSNSETVYTGTAEPKRVNDPNCSDNLIKHGSTGTTWAATIIEKDSNRPYSYGDDPIEENLGVVPSDVILHQEGVSQRLSEQFNGEELESEKLGGNTIENPSVDPSCSNVLPNACVDYHIPYAPKDMNEGSMFPGHSAASVEKENMSTSDLYNRNFELAQIVKELKERAVALEKKQVESELEMQQLRNVVKDSGVQIQQLKNCVQELESKLLRSVGSENVIYLIGGFNGKSWLSALDSFSPSLDILMPLKSMGSARSYASAASLNGDLYVFGGGDGNSWFRSVECYSPTNDNWTLCSPLIREKGSLAGATLNGKIFALGGGNGTDSFADVEMLDPSLGRWIYNQSMLQKRFAPAAAVLHDVLYTTGGFDGKNYLETAERLDPRVGYWTKMPNMGTRRGCHSMAVFNDKLYVMGGFDGTRMIPNVEIFDPRNNSWIEGEPLNRVRGYAGAAVLGGSLFVIGGIDDNNNVVETVECLSDGTGWINCVHKAVGKRCFFSAIVP